MLVFLGLSKAVFADWIQPPLATETGYRVPQPDFEPEIPRDHGAHPGYAIEWWYWVGHLKSVDGERHFGFQSTVFRLEGNAERTHRPEKPSPFGDQQLYMAHVSLSDLESGKYLHAERILREGWQAQISSGTLDLQVGPIIARWQEDGPTIEKTLALPEGRTLKLKLKPKKPLVVFGERGLSRKGSSPSAVSWYWTYTRLEISGVLIESDKHTKVVGIGWMDHEVSSSQLGSDLVGWDWTAIHLDDGTELKAYRLRNEQGGADPWSAVYWIDPGGETVRVYAEDFEWKVEEAWESDRTGNRYPTGVIIKVQHPETKDTETYHLRPLLNEQEFVGNRSDNAYWEGACAVFDKADKRIGSAYLELVGYSGSILGELSR